MPYVDPETRDRLGYGELATGAIPTTSGELNYAVTQLVQAFLTQRGTRSPRYADYNEAVGALECAKLELYRRKVAAYEDFKKQMFGDVYV